VNAGVPWRKLLLIGCALAVLCGGCVVGGVWLLLDSIKSSGAYTQAVQKAQADPRVVAALGAPVEPDWYVMGSVDLVNDGGHAELSIPLQGSKRFGGTPRTGKLIVVADKAGGVWTLTKLDLVTATGPETYNTQPLLP
jgi:hypothetical protein